MPIAITSTGLCSNALVRLGANPISSFEENTTEATVARAVYETTKQSYLSRHPWKFALRFQALTYIDTDVAPTLDGEQYDYCYNLPSNAILVYGLESRDEFQIFQGRLYTDDDEAKVLYIENVQESDFPPYFQEALTLQLQAEMCYAVTADRPEAATLQDRARRAWTFAKNSDSKQSTTFGLSVAVQELLQRDTTQRL